MRHFNPLALIGAAALALAVSSPASANCLLSDSGCFDSSPGSGYGSREYGYGSSSRQERSERSRRNDNGWSHRDNISQHGITNCGISGCNSYERSPESRRNITDHGITNCGISGC